MRGRVDSWRLAFARGLAAFVAITTVLTVRPASSAPGDIFTQAAPTIGADPPKAAALQAGDASVATTTGALEYSYPIAVPPGRNGMAPKVALTYSSQGSLYGGIASNWSLPIPIISEDFSVGRLKTRSPEVEAFEQANNLDYRADDRFVSSLAGGQRLVGVVDWALAPGVYSAYRAVNDSSFARYERMQGNEAFRWRVRTTDGTTMIFGDSSVAGKGTFACSSADPVANLISDRYAPLTSITDSFGNSVQYVYEQLNVGECRLKEITWGHNPDAGFIGAFARVAFNWTTPSACNGVIPNSQTDYRSGIRLLTGASKLTSIVATAFAPSTPTNIEHTRQIDLKYNDGTGGTPNAESCTQNRSPLRQLASIQESAWGIDAPLVTLPPVKFSYSPTTVLTTDQTAPLAWLDSITSRSANLGWGYRRNDDRWPTVEAMLLDIDGDGRLDRVTNPDAESAQSSCRARWVRNMGAAGWQQPTNFEIALPRLKWRGSATEAGNTTSGSSSAYRPLSGGGNSLAYENCSLNGQVTAWKNSTENGLGFCHVAKGAAPLPCTIGQNDCPGGTRCPLDESGPYTSDYRTYLAYRWLDVDSDGLVDLVAAAHGKIDAYDLERGNLVNGTGDYRNGEPSISGIPGVLQWPLCSGGSPNLCVDAGPDLDGARNCTSGPCSYNWTLINSILGSTTPKPCFNVLARPAGQGGGSSYTPSRAPYTRCNGLYPWFIYKNQGNGVFATTPIIKYQPIPLESDAGDSALHGPSMTAQHHGILDFDGDGILDAVVHGKQWALSNPDAIFVWLGDGTGGFGPKRFTFPTRPKGPQENDNALSGTKSIGLTVEEGLGVRDLNGDGLPDHWLTNLTSSNVAIHDGARNRLVTGANGPTGELTITSALNNTALFTLYPSTGFPETGTSVAQFRQLDVDADGRIDTVDARTGSPLVYWNYGGAFATSSSAYPHARGPSNDGLSRRSIGTFSGSTASLEPYAWELKSDLIDLDGNGVPENIYFDSATHRIMESSPTTPQRLMSQIDNGRGARTNITYSHMQDSTTVLQDLNAVWPDNGRRKVSPRSQWVVKSMQSVDDFPTTTSTTTYFYKHPRFGADDEGKYAFRGFEEVTTTSNSGARTVQTYAFDVDKTGRLVRTATFSAETPTNPTSVSRTTWESRLSLNGAVKTFHTTLSEAFTCGNGLTEAQCTTLPVTNATTGYTQTVATLTAYPPTGTPLLWQEDTTLLRSSNGNADGDREAKMTATLIANSTQYFFRPIGVIKNHRVGGAMVTYAQSATTWDASWRVPLTKETWVDSVAQNRSIARTEYDMATGNPTEQFKPNQNAASTTKTVLEYDSRKLFPAKVTNEAGHVVDAIYEYGTGTKLQTDGPNTRICVVGQPNCPADAFHPPREQHRIKIDGLGRTLERWETVGDETQYVYTSVKAETATYVDQPPTGIPTSVTTQSVIDESETTPRWTLQTTQHDGHGRPIKTTVDVQGTIDHVTNYVYNANGFLTSVSVPDPHVNSSAQVTYLYTYDSLGRPLTIRRPDATMPADKSGVNLTYDGRKKTGVEVVGSGGGNVGQVESWVDFYGRVSQLKETSAANTFQTTTYTYDPLDNVKSIVDPQGGTITMQHDFAGRRTQITRPGSRTWKYTYDRNGNISSEQVPGSTNPPITDPLYTNTFAYDDLDRVTSKVIAPRQLSAPDRDLFIANSESFTYDIGFIGSLRFWRAYGVSVGAEMAVDTYADGLGRTTLVSQSHGVAGYPAMTRGVGQGFNVNGTPRFVRQYDFMGGSNETIWTYQYDERGLPSRIQLMSPQAIDLAVQTRNIAGLVTNRRTTFATGPMSYAESVWTYDVLGRATVQLVQKNTSPTQIAQQSMQYTGTDDVKQMIHAIGSTSRTIDYTYDHRHQIKTATSGTYFGGTYNYGNAGRVTSVSQTRTASGILGADPRLVRNVNYAYGSTDPERVTALTNVSNGSTYASYTYDDAGNQLTRSYPASNELFEYVYDGKDQLRRVTRKLSGSVTGSEEYWYDANGQRMAVVKRDASGAKTELIWFIGEAQAHYNSTGALTKIYSHLSMGTPVARIERTSDTTTTLELQFHGLASNTIAAVAQDGTINARFAYAPFGEVLEATGQGVAVHKRRFNDKIEDDLGGLTYYGARYYDKVSLGWTQADPLYLRTPDLARRSSPRRSQVLVFSLNNPNRYFDPDGRDANIRMSHSGDLSSYRSGKETSEAARAAAIAADEWTVGGCGNFSNQCSSGGSGGAWGAVANSGCPLGTDPQPGGGCGISERPENPAKWASAVTTAPVGPVEASKNPEFVRQVIAAAVATWCPGCGLVIGLSGARNENEIATPILLWGVGIVVGTVKAAGSRTPDLTPVSRWGRPGLEAGDWVMKGTASRWNYFWSGKWQPGFGNQYAPFNSGATYLVPPSSLRWPSGFGVDGWVKGLLGQRRYMGTSLSPPTPPPSLTGAVE